MLTWLKRWLKRYDDWCKELGLTPENKRCCTPYRKETQNDEPSDQVK
jgi:hypothetical protein